VDCYKIIPDFRLVDGMLFIFTDIKLSRKEKEQARLAGLDFFIWRDKVYGKKSGDIISALKNKRKINVCSLFK
jgi:hypothetical protein